MTGLNIDPTRSRLLRLKYLMRVEHVIESLIEEIVGVDKGLTNNARKYRPAVNRIEPYMEWLTDKIDKKLVDRKWTNSLVAEGHKRGIMRGYGDLHGLPQSKPTPMQVGFLKGVAAKQGTLKNLQERAFTDLQGISTAMSDQIRRTLIEGVSKGLAQADIVSAIVDRVKKIGLTRAKTLVQSEITRAHSEGVLDALEYAGVKEVGFNIEWTTTKNPCQLCAPLRGLVLTIAQARGLFPRHPRCMCSPMPSKLSTHKTRIQAKINKSVKEEIPKSLRSKRKSAKEQRKRSRWLGANR